MTRKMIINAIDSEEVRIAIINNRLLEDFDIEMRGVEKNKGNIYKGLVRAVEPALNAAFINYGVEKQGFLTANDVHPKYAHDTTATNDKVPKIEKFLKPGQTVLVQVAKDEVSTKGAVLTTFLSLAGRYLVLMPDSETQGVSRKIDDEQIRRKVREAAAKLEVPENMGVIIRTAGCDRTKADLNRDLRVLLRLWENIQKEATVAKAPALIFKEQDVIIRTLRDYFSADIDEIVLDSDEAYDRAAEYMHLVMPNHRSVLTRYVERRPIFHHYRIEEQLELIYTPKVNLPSGGSLVIESTEALVAIDVNSGKQKAINQEETALQTNLEAVIEVARQLRLRDLGGIVVVDLIDMLLPKNQRKVEQAIKEALREDKARVKVRRISGNGTLEITRQRIRSALQATVFDKCQTCQGTGHVLNPASHAVAVMRKLRDRASRGDLQAVKIRVEPAVANRLKTQNWQMLQDTEKRYNLRVEILAEHTFHAGQDDFTFETNPQAAVLPLEEPNFGPAHRPQFAEDIQVFEDPEDADESSDELLLFDDATLEQSHQRITKPKTSAGATPQADPHARASRNRLSNRRKQGLAKQSSNDQPLLPEDPDNLLGLPTFEWVNLKNLPQHLVVQTKRPREGTPTTSRNVRQRNNPSRPNQQAARTAASRAAHTNKEPVGSDKPTANKAVIAKSVPSIVSRFLGWLRK